jgi:hypothetical protein
MRAFFLSIFVGQQMLFHARTKMIEMKTLMPSKLIYKEDKYIFK